MLDDSFSNYGKNDQSDNNSALGLISKDDESVKQEDQNTISTPKKMMDHPTLGKIEQSEWEEFLLKERFETYKR